MFVRMSQGKSVKQNCKENPSSVYKTTSQNIDHLKRRSIHTSQGFKNKRDSSQKDNANNLYPELEEYIDADYVKKDEDSADSAAYVKKDEVSADGEPIIRNRSNECTALNQNLTVVTESSNLYDFITKHLRKVTILILILFIYMTGSGIYSYVINKSNGENICYVSKLIHIISSEFNDQSNHTFRILKSALKPIVNERFEPPAPAVIILLANKNTVQTAWKFSEYLAELLDPEEFFKIDNRIYGDGKPEIIKSNIDEKLRSLKPDSLNVIMVDDLAKVPFHAAMIFHSYCDHENARIKRAVYLFVVPSDEIVPADAGSKHIDGTAMKRLKQIWHKANTDLIESLITRLTVSVVYIK